MTLLHLKNQLQQCCDLSAGDNLGGLLSNEAAPLAQPLHGVGDVVEINFGGLGLDEAPQAPQQVAHRYVGARRGLPGAHRHIHHIID